MPFTWTALRDLISAKENNLRSHPLHGHPKWLNCKEPSCQCSWYGFNLWVGKIPWRRKWQPTPVFLPGESHGQKSLAGYSPWGRKESDTTEQLTHTLLEKEMATHPNILAWEVPHTEESGGLQPMGPQRVGHNWANTRTHVPSMPKPNTARVCFLRMLPQDTETAGYSSFYDEQAWDWSSALQLSQSLMLGGQCNPVAQFSSKVKLKTTSVIDLIVGHCEEWMSSYR